jgi:hypothetical protein
MRHLPLIASLLLAGCEPEPTIRSYQVPRDGGAVAPSPAAPSAGKPAMQASPEMVAAAAKEGRPSFPAAPSGWTAKDPGAMRKGSWSVGPADAAADLAVTVFPGDVGGRVANFNRWRQQLGLAPATAEAFDAIQVAKVGSLEGEVVQFTSADGATATRAVLVAHKGSTWFFKLTGPAATVKAASGPFDAFVAATQLP